MTRRRAGDAPGHTRPIRRRGRGPRPIRHRRDGKDRQPRRQAQTTHLSGDRCITAASTTGVGAPARRRSSRRWPAAAVMSVHQADGARWGYRLSCARAMRHHAWAIDDARMRTYERIAPWRGGARSLGSRPAAACQRLGARIRSRGRGFVARACARAADSSAIPTRTDEGMAEAMRQAKRLGCPPQGKRCSSVPRAAAEALATRQADG
jgi:hypothetical protein